jgi:hypothetical protein
VKLTQALKKITGVLKEENACLIRSAAFCLKGKTAVETRLGDLKT